MSRRASQPLNSAAVAAANEDLYGSHENDPRPNALFDENGNRLQLDPNDPAQAGLREEWMDAYIAHGGEVEGAPPSDREPDQPDQPCPEDPAHLTVFVRYTPRDAPVKGATVSIEGPYSAQMVTGDDGIADFPGIPPGGYDIDVRLDSGDALVDSARSHIGSTSWAYWRARPPYPADANKCNLFVYEMANGVGRTVPQRTRWSWRQRRDVWYPPLAGEWGDPGTTVGSWTVVSDPVPGDVIAEPHLYADATGHVGIVSYPLPNGESQSLAAGEHLTTTIELPRQTVSAGGDEILENDWGWRQGQTPTFRRYSP